MHRGPSATRGVVSLEAGELNNHLRRLEVDGFRGFEHLVVDDLADVNVIVGENNVGKTALLESLVLLGQPCLIDNSLTLNEVRGLARVSLDTTETWSLHFNQRLRAPIVRIVGTEADGGQRKLSFQVGPGAELYAERHDRPANWPGKYSKTFMQQQVVRFDYSHTDGEVAWAVATIVGGELVVIDTTALPTPVMGFHASSWRLFYNVPQLYSEVVQRGEEDLFLVGLRSIAPSMSQLRLLTRAGVPTLYASLDDGPLLPVQAMGDGVARVASWLLSMVRLGNSWYLIDEIENGIHHGVMSDVWRALLTAAKARNVQVFATTHSYEALEALNKARRTLGQDAPGVRVIRLQRTKGDLAAITYNEEVLDAAISADVEVR
jgi:hypothetical protein